MSKNKTIQDRLIATILIPKQTPWNILSDCHYLNHLDQRDEGEASPEQHCENCMRWNVIIYTQMNKNETIQGRLINIVLIPKQKSDCNCNYTWNALSDFHNLNTWLNGTNWRRRRTKTCGQWCWMNGMTERRHRSHRTNTCENCSWNVVIYDQMDKNKTTQRKRINIVLISKQTLDYMFVKFSWFEYSVNQSYQTHGVAKIMFCTSGAIGF